MLPVKEHVEGTAQGIGETAAMRIERKQIPGDTAEFRVRISTRLRGGGIEGVHLWEISGIRSTLPYCSGADEPGHTCYAQAGWTLKVRTNG
ncbi:hypothetical protein GCM10009642_03230 [Nocardiopsis metallicus]